MMLSQELQNRLIEAVEQFYDGPPLSTEHAKAHWDLAMEIRQHLEQDPGLLSDIEDEIDMEVSGWLLDLPLTLATHNMVDEAATLGTLYAEITEAENFLGDRAVILAEAGRREDALAQLADNLLRFPNDPWVVIKGGDVHDALGDPAQAEHLYRRALEIAWDDQYTRTGAVERLVPLLDNSGREEEADALMKEETARQTPLQQLWKDMPDEKTADQTMPLLSGTAADSIVEEDDVADVSLPYTRPQSKIGRNDPCPCGSGKKYKKCCLGKT